MYPFCNSLSVHFVPVRDTFFLSLLKTLKTFIATVCQYNTIQYNVICLKNAYKINILSISKRLYIKTRGPNCKL